jgi:anthranilate synthase component 1
VTDGRVEPGREEFRAALAGERVVPVVRRLLADGETPISAFRKLAGERSGTFLLESAEHGGLWSRYSFIGVRSAATLSERDGKAHWSGVGPDDFPDDPLAALRDASERLRSTRRPGLPTLTGGLVGYLGYDAVRRLERLPTHAIDDLGLPELQFMLATDLAVLDHLDGTILLVANVIRGLSLGASDDTASDPDQAYDDAIARLDVMTAALAAPSESGVSTFSRTPYPFVGRTPEGEYAKSVEIAKEYIRAGDVFQVVPSQRFETETTASPLDVYRVLRASNPSPYMYLLRFDDLAVVGSSPEASIRVEGRHAMLHPIAGTRPRGETPDDDLRLASELIRDEKERAEHVMLVDLGRNDLGRVCAPGTVKVVELMAIERYSHVMHIVSTVVGDLTPGMTAFDALTATFPAGTLSGAPKVRAMEIIDELEPVRRGIYSGVVGYLDAAGDLDMAIAIRTTVMHAGKAYVQAGAGIVADSNPDLEEQESRNKAATVLSALAAANTLRSAGPADATSV